MILAAAALGLTACSDGDKTTASMLTVSRNGNAITQLDLPLAESVVVLSVNTDADWRVSVPDADTTWLHLTPHAGYGWAVADSTAINLNAYVKLTVDHNNDAARSSALTFSAGDMQVVVAVNQSGVGDGNDPIENVWQMLNNWRLGYNLGNTLDASADPALSWFNPSGTGDWQAYETVWGQPVTTTDIIGDIVGKGFNVIRVPVTWHPHVDADWNIDQTWMDRVQKVVDMVIDAGAYAIVNVMHDTGENTSASATYNAGWLKADADTYAENTVRFQKLWQQIATRFRDYDEHLVFESFNEILNKSNSWTVPAAGNDAYDVINKLQQDFVNTVRATGGNNQWRNLAITTYAATGASDAPVSSLQLPQDPSTGHIYLSIHSYDPYNFCNNNSGKNDGVEYDYNIYVFNDECTSTIDQVVNRVSKRAEQLGIPFVFGEFGAIDENKDMGERIKYATYVAQKLKENHTTGLWWMGLYDRKQNKWYEEEIVNALTSIMK